MGLEKLGKIVLSNSGKNLCKNIASKVLAKPANIKFFSKPIKSIKVPEPPKVPKLPKVPKKEVLKQAEAMFNSRKKLL